MKSPRERSSAERGEGSERGAPARRSATPENPVLAARGLALDGLGNRALLALLHAGRFPRERAGAGPVIPPKPRRTAPQATL